MRRLIALFATATVSLFLLDVSTTLPTTSTALLEDKTTTHASVNCLERRGTRGRWVQSWDYARRSNYTVYGSYNLAHVATQRFQPTDDMPFRKATSWMWQDDECPVHEVSLKQFCQACRKLDLTRFLMIGDSLTFQFVFSLLSLLGFPPRNRRWSFNGMIEPLQYHV